MQKIKINRDKALNYWKIKNFANITTGLRTPLMLLHAPIEYFINHYGEIPDNEAKSLLNIMRKNVKTMNDQIDSFIELSKSEVENTVLRLQSIDLGTLITNIFNSLRSRAELKNISYEMNINIKDVKTVVDPTKIEVVVFNLLNNSIRMVPENGKITLSCYLDKKRYSYCIKISDNSTFYENAKTLFFMGEQVLLRGNKYTNEFLKSEFFHLSVVYDFIQLHKGKLSITRNENGGTDYDVVILLGVSHYSAEQLDSLETPKGDVYSHYQVLSTPNENISGSEKLDVEQFLRNDTNIPSIVGIDIKADLLSIIKTELMGEYKLTGYPFDKNIIEKIKKRKCSAVIIDIPNKYAASLQLISMLKKESSLANIPIVVFSENADDDFEHFCYDLGVDIWLKKPFDLRYFHTRIKNIIKSREKMTEIIKQKLIVNPKEINILSNDEVFLANVMEVIERNMSNEGFAVEMLAAELNISHSALYRKLLQLTEQSPVDFIRTIRLKRAAQLLRSHNYLVSEVCLMVGFSDQRYFSTCFKRLYGIGPKAYSLEKNDKNHSEEKGNV